MKNLFVCHTQAQLILACGLSKGRLSNDINELILYLDFSLGNEMRERIENMFSRVLYLQGIYPKELNTYKAKLFYYPKGLRLVRAFLQGEYHHVFVICDTVLLTQKIMQYVWHRNRKVHFSWLEDGIAAYYCDTDVKSGLDSNRFTLLVRTFIFKYLFRTGRFYNRIFPEAGGSLCIEDAYVLFPQLTQEPYRSNRTLIRITPQEYHMGLQTLYSIKPIHFDEKSVILVMDLISRYKYPNDVHEKLALYIQKWQREGFTVYCKFHPREEQNWEIFNTCISLESKIGVESIYLSLFDSHKTLRVVGIKSTGLMSAKLLGFETISLFPICRETNENLLNFYRALGIEICE